MPVTRDIVRTWRRPRRVIREHLSAGPREDRAIAVLMGGCLMAWVAQWPNLTRTAMETGDEAMQLIGTSFYGWMLLMPLAFYGIAALSHLIARVFGGRGSFYSARLALFWTLLATSPLLLFYGLLLGFNGREPGTQLIGGLWVVAFLAIWVSTLLEAEQ